MDVTSCPRERSGSESAALPFLVIPSESEGSGGRVALNPLALKGLWPNHRSQGRKGNSSNTYYRFRSQAQLVPDAPAFASLSEMSLFG
jgi:hypothetical protein